jgi:hypothetical protein
MLARGRAKMKQTMESVFEISRVSPSKKTTRRRAFRREQQTTYFSMMITEYPAWVICRACSSASARVEKVPRWTR